MPQPAMLKHHQKSVPLNQKKSMKSILVTKFMRICDLNYHLIPSEITAKQIKEETSDLVDRWKNNEFKVNHVRIYTRACQGSGAAVARAAVGGICHTFIIIETGPSSFILERLEEGVRFASLNAKEVREHKSGATQMYKEETLSLSSSGIAKWIEEQAAIKYSLLSNNCIHFVWIFGVKFKCKGKLFSGGFIRFCKQSCKFLSFITGLTRVFTVAWNGKQHQVPLNRT